VAAALFALVAPAAGPAQQIPGVISVDTTRDGNDNECAKDCTLREAVAVAAASGTETPILVPAGVYKLNSTLTLPNNTALFGGGFSGNTSGGARGTVIDGRNQNRVLQVPDGATALVAGFRITNGRAANGAGALVGSGSQLQFYNSIVDGNVATTRGGGVDASDGSVSLFGSTVSNNRVTGGSGGGYAGDIDSDLVADASTFSGNTASGAGGGIASAGSLTILNATIADNSAPSGAAVQIEPGVGSGSSNIANTILASGTGVTCGGFSGQHFGWSGNLADDGTCAFAPGEGTPSVNPLLGALTNNRGPTDTMALKDGSPAIDAGDTNRCFGQDQRGARAVGTCDIGAYEFKGVVPEAQVGQPVAGESIVASKSQGTVKVRLPGSDDFFVLQDGQQLPMGTTFDTSHGRVNIRADQGGGVANKKAWFYQGVFKVNQTKGKKPLTTLTMTGKLQCGGKGKASAALKKKKTRRLWGNGKGHFRTKGKNSAATVLGTKWLVEDRCNGTLTKVVRGVVKVRDFKKKKTVTVRAGHSYFAKR
jgi:predicted outer membrane repeat protein